MMISLRLNFLLILLASVLLMASCGKKKRMANSEEKTEEVTIPTPEVEKVIVDENFVPPRENGRFEVERMEMEGDHLKLTVSYSGGCEEHIFHLHSNGKYAKSYPPQITLFLEHIDNNDRCRAMINKELIFDVSNVQYPGTSELMIRLNNTDKTLQYKY